MHDGVRKRFDSQRAEKRDISSLRTKVYLELTPPGTPQMNGKVERRQTVLIYKSLAAMHAANLKKSTRRMLWNEAVNYSKYTLAIAYSRTSGSYSYKLFNKKASKLVKHLQSFGRIGEVAEKEKIHGRWTDQSTKMIMVGRAKNSTADTHRMYNPKTKKVHMPDLRRNEDGLEEARSTT